MTISQTNEQTLSRWDTIDSSLMFWTVTASSWWPCSVFYIKQKVNLQSKRIPYTDEKYNICQKLNTLHTLFDIQQHVNTTHQSL